MIDGYKEYIVIYNKAVEYFCCVCGQIRLAPEGIPDKCYNCGVNKTNLIVGKPGELDKEKLKSNYKKVHNECT